MSHAIAGRPRRDVSIIGPVRPASGPSLDDGAPRVILLVSPVVMAVTFVADIHALRMAPARAHA